MIEKIFIGALIFSLCFFLISGGITILRLK